MKNKPQKTSAAVALVSIWVNTALSLLKLLAGVLAHSGAMISDAVHSASDVFSSIIVIIGVKLAGKKADEHHPYGHERLESAAAIVLSVLLLVTGLFIGHTAIEKLTSPQQALVIPELPALMAALISIIIKEWMYWYTRFHAKRLRSDALMADAWHHRSDALSSVGALIGIAGAMLGYGFMEPLASLVICGFIVKAACDIFLESTRKMIDHACDEDTQESIRSKALETEGVLSVEVLRTREFGSRIYVDLALGVNGDLTVREGDAIAEKVHKAMEKTFPEIKHIIVKVKPAPTQPSTAEPASVQGKSADPSST